MRLDELMERLDAVGYYESEVVVEINGVAHVIHDVLAESGDVVIAVDLDEEERSMRDIQNRDTNADPHLRAQRIEELRELQEHE